MFLGKWVLRNTWVKQHLLLQVSISNAEKRHRLNKSKHCPSYLYISCETVMLKWTYCEIKHCEHQNSSLLSWLFVPHHISHLCYICGSKGLSQVHQWSHQGVFLSATHPPKHTISSLRHCFAMWKKKQKIAKNCATLKLYFSI